MATTMIYLDYNATTPLDPRVREAMLPWLGSEFGNPSSLHRIGQRARSMIDDCRHRVASLWKCKASEIVFTSGGTESVNLALLGAARQLRQKGRHIITSALEHHAVLHPLRFLAACEGFELTEVAPDAEGYVRPEAIAECIRPDTILVSLMAANNEIGTIQPVAAVGRICRERGVVFHTDAVQWFGKEELLDIHAFQAHLVSACAHKFHGPKGSGALFVESPLTLSPLLLGGPQELDRRAGTENVAAIVGFAEALALFGNPPVFKSSEVPTLTALLEERVKRIENTLVAGSKRPRLCNTLGVIVDGTNSLSLVAGLDLAGVCVSAGAACSSGALMPSHVIQALGVEDHRAKAFVRFSLGTDTTAEMIRHVGTLLEQVVSNIREAGR